MNKPIISDLPHKRCLTCDKEIALNETVCRDHLNKTEEWEKKIKEFISLETLEKVKKTTCPMSDYVFHTTGKNGYRAQCGVCGGSYITPASITLEEKAKKIADLFSLALAQRDEEIKRAIYLLKNIVLVRVNDESYLRVKREEEVNLKNAIEILSHLQETEGK